KKSPPRGLRVGQRFVRDADSVLLADADPDLGAVRVGIQHRDHLACDRREPAGLVHLVQHLGRLQLEELALSLLQRQLHQSAFPSHASTSRTNDWTGTSETGPSSRVSVPPCARSAFRARTVRATAASRRECSGRAGPLLTSTSTGRRAPPTTKSTSSASSR